MILRLLRLQLGSMLPISTEQPLEGPSAAGLGAPLLLCGVPDRELEPCTSFPTLTSKQAASLGHSRAPGTRRLPFRAEGCPELPT